MSKSENKAVKIVILVAAMLVTMVIGTFAARAIFKNTYPQLPEREMAERIYDGQLAYALQNGTTKPKPLEEDEEVEKLKLEMNKVVLITNLVIAGLFIGPFVGYQVWDTRMFKRYLVEGADQMDYADWRWKQVDDWKKSHRMKPMPEED